MQHHNNYRVAKAVIARWLTALVTGERESIWEEPSLEYLRKAERIMLLSATMEVTAYIHTQKGKAALKCITPVWNTGSKLWVTQGHLCHGL